MMKRRISAKAVVPYFAIENPFPLGPALLGSIHSMAKTYIVVNKTATSVIQIGKMSTKIGHTLPSRKNALIDSFLTRSYAISHE